MGPTSNRGDNVCWNIYAWLIYHTYMITHIYIYVNVCWNIYAWLAYIAHIDNMHLHICQYMLEHICMADIYLHIYQCMLEYICMADIYYTYMITYKWKYMSYILHTCTC